ncbi:MAG: replicative DNA helicase [Planctomycetaceae bacterium]|nr:replicative DNA helicase [Planctomycetaceae bacterium]
MIEHSQPQNLDAEKGVIGAILINPFTCDEVATILRTEDFYSEVHQKLYRHLMEMHGGGSGIDLTLLLERLERAGDLVEIGGEAYLGEIMSDVQVAAHAPQYAEIVRDKAILRDLIETSAEILRSAYDPTLGPREIVNRAEEKIFALSDSRNSNQVHKIFDVINETFSILNARAEGATDGTATGFLDFDAMTGGLHPGELIILAARPSMGKTALATNIADYAAVKQKVPTLFVSLEMSRLELGQRMLCSRGRIDSHKLRSATLSKMEKEQLMKAGNELSTAPLIIDDSPSRTVTEIGAVARRVKRQEGGLGLIVIDYLGLIEPDMPTDPRQEQVAKIARRLKGLARELQVPVLCLAQLNRQAEATKDNRPRLSHLRESGAIEQDADVVMFVHREEYYHKPEQAEDMGIVGQADLMIAKQRNGPVGDIKLAWFGKHTRFTNLSEPEAYDEFSQHSGEDANFGL